MRLMPNVETTCQHVVDGNAKFGLVLARRNFLLGTASILILGGSVNRSASVKFIVDTNWSPN